MSHIPSSVMPRAGPVHHDEPAATARPAERRRVADWPIAAVALGGALALGAVAVAVPLLRGAAKPKRKGSGRRKDRD